MQQVQSKDKRLYLAIALFSLTINSYFTALPFYLKELGVGSREIGISFASYFICYLTLCLYQNKTAQRPNKIVIISLIMVLITTLTAFEIAQSIRATSIFYLFSAMLGLLQASIWPIIMAKIVTNIRENELNKRLSRFNLSWAIPMLISPMLAALLFNKHMVYISILIIFLLLSLLIILSFISLSEVPTTKQYRKKKTNVTAHLSTPLIALFASSSLICVSIVVILYKTHVAQLMIVKLNFIETKFALVVTFANLGAVVIFFIQERWHHWQWKKAWLIGAQLMAVVALLCVLSEKLALLLIGAFIAGLAHGFMYGAHQFYMSALITTRLQAMSKHEMVQSGGIISGSLLAGFAGEINFSMPYTLALVILITALFYQWLIQFKAPQNTLPSLTSNLMKSKHKQQH